MKQVFTFLFCCFFASAFSQGHKELEKEVYKLLNAKKYKEALKQVNKAIKNDPKNAMYYVLRSRVNYHSGSLKDALADCDKAFVLEPENAQLYLNRGQLFFYSVMPEEALSDFTDGLKYIKKGEDSLKLELICHRGSAKNMMRDFQGAYDDFTLVLSFDSTNINALSNTAMVCDEVGRGDETIGYLMKVLALDPDFIAAYINLGFKYIAMEKYAEAIQMFDQAVRIDPNEAFTYNNRGYARMMLDDNRGAMDDINRSIKLDPSNSYAYRNRALLLIKLGKIEMACADLQAAISLGFTDRYGKEVERLQREHCGM